MQGVWFDVGGGVSVGVVVVVVVDVVVVVVVVVVSVVVAVVVGGGGVVCLLLEGVLCNYEQEYMLVYWKINDI